MRKRLKIRSPKSPRSEKKKIKEALKQANEAYKNGKPPGAEYR